MIAKDLKAGEVITLVQSDGKKLELSKDDIDDQQESQMSPMPENVTELVEGEDLYHLLDYLMTQRVETGQ